METVLTPYEQLLKFLPFIIPIVLLQLILMIVALVDLSRREKTRGPKWVWALVIIFGELVGPIVYFVIGREE
jgi:DMSO reductase anchor subunit